MSYSDFTMELVEKRFGLTTRADSLFPGAAPLPVPPWLRQTLDKGMQLALISEKARSEFIVVPVLLACRELSHNRFAIYSGQRLDVDAQRGLTGECDFILTKSDPVPLLRAPVATIVEAKKNDVEGGLGQCAAEMFGAREFNRKEQQEVPVIYGCVTTGEAWQFLSLEQSTVSLDRKRYYIDNVGGILAAIGAMMA